MSFTRIFFISSIFLLIYVVTFSFLKKNKTDRAEKINKIEEIEVSLFEKMPVVSIKEKENIESKDVEVDIIEKLFTLDSTKLPIVETITYTMRVPWLSDRPAWLTDYAAHYETTRHFIARSLNKKADYFTQNVSQGDRFNVLKKNVSFDLVISFSNLKLYFYALDKDTQERYLLKTYKVGVGRKDLKKESGSLTPKGKFLIGDKVAIYKTGITGYFQGNQIEMIKVFGTRWIPFERSYLDDMSKGLGIHGAPWVFDENKQKLIEDRSKIGQFDSDGCIRLYSEDIEEIFAIVITKPTTVHIVNDQTEIDFEKIEE